MFIPRGYSKSRLHLIDVFNSLNTKDADIVRKIASEFPFGMDIVLDEYLLNDCSEMKTRSVLQERLMKGV